jgi:hypothetical protein
MCYTKTMRSNGSCVNVTVIYADKKSKAFPKTILTKIPNPISRNSLSIFSRNSLSRYSPKPDFHETPWADFYETSLKRIFTKLLKQFSRNSQPQNNSTCQSLVRNFTHISNETRNVRVDIARRLYLKYGCQRADFHGTQLCYTSFHEEPYTKFHQNPTNGLVADKKWQMWRVLLLRHKGIMTKPSFTVRSNPA